MDQKTKEDVCGGRGGKVHFSEIKYINIKHIIYDQPHCALRNCESKPQLDNHSTPFSRTMLFQNYCLKQLLRRM